MAGWWCRACMDRRCACRPLVLLLAILLGTQLLGVLGTVLAVPVAAGIRVVVAHVAMADRDHVTSAVARRRALRREYDSAGRAVHTTRTMADGSDGARGPR